MPAHCVDTCYMTRSQESILEHRLVLGGDPIHLCSDASASADPCLAAVPWGSSSCLLTDCSGLATTERWGYNGGRLFTTPLQICWLHKARDTGSWGKPRILGLYCLQAGRVFFLPVQGSGLSTSESCLHHLQAVHSWACHFLGFIFSSVNVGNSG